MTFPTQDFPLFPLSSVLYPQGILPLQIFEVRYLDLIKRCVAQQQPFGVVALLEGHEVRKPNERIQLVSVGTAAHIVRQQPMGPALVRIRCKGGQRFKLLDHHQAPSGLWMGKVEWLDDPKPVRVPEHLEVCAQKLGELLESLKARQLDDMDWPVDQPFELHDCAWVAQRWCELLPLKVSVKISLLALDNPLMQLELVSDVLHEQGLV